MNSSQSDRDRVLMNIAVDTSGTVHDEMRRLKKGWTLRFIFDRPAGQFIPTEMAKAIQMPLVPGDIVRCRTNPKHPWGISEYVEDIPDGALLRQIGSDRLLNMTNESFDVLRFMTPSRLYTGKKLQVYNWASGKAFSKRYNPDADYYKRCGGVEFSGELPGYQPPRNAPVGQVVIWSRAHIWAQEKRQGDATTYAHPRSFVLTWSKSTRLRDIVAAMKAQGFAEDFEYTPEKPEVGNAGFSSFTRESLLAAVPALFGASS